MEFFLRFIGLGTLYPCSSLGLHCLMTFPLGQHWMNWQAALTAVEGQIWLWFLLPLIVQVNSCVWCPFAKSFSFWWWDWFSSRRGDCYRCCCKCRRIRTTTDFSVILLRLPGAVLKPFALDTNSLPGLDAPAHHWQDWVGVNPLHNRSIFYFLIQGLLQ